MHIQYQALFPGGREDPAEIRPTFALLSAQTGNSIGSECDDRAPSACRSDRIREVGQLLLRTQNVNLQKPSAMRSKGKVAFAHRFPVTPVTPDYSPFVSESLRERFITTVWQLSTARSPKAASECAPRTDPPRRGEDHECICALDQEGVVDVIAVNNPPLTSKQSTLFLEELVLWHQDPTGIPTMKVERDNGKASLLRKHP